VRTLGRPAFLWAKKKSSRAAALGRCVRGRPRCIATLPRRGARPVRQQTVLGRRRPLPLSRGSDFRMPTAWPALPGRRRQLTIRTIGVRT
jgi:hypothetical protein